MFTMFDLAQWWILCAFNVFVCLCVQMNVGYVYVNVCVWNACVHKCVDVYSSVSCLVKDILAFPPPR